MELTHIAENFIQFDQSNTYEDCYIKQKGIRRYLFTWLGSFLDANLNASLIEQNKLFKIHEEEKAQHLVSTFDAVFERQKALGGQGIGILLKSLFLAFKWDWLIILLLRMSYMGIILLNPLVIKQIINLFQGDRQQYALYIQTICIFLGWIVVLYASVSVGLFYMKVFQYKIQIALSAKIHTHLFASSLPLVPNAELVTFLQIDVSQIADVTNSLCTLVLIPFQLFGSLYIYYSQLGMAANVGVIGMIVQMILSVLYGHQYSTYQNSIMNARDERGKGIDELLGGINVIKQNCYYRYFYNKIQLRRQKEMYQIKKQSYLRFFMTFVFQLIPIAVMFTTFQLFEMFSLDSILLINQNYQILVQVINQIPTLLSGVLLSMTSMERVMSFLMNEQTQRNVCRRQSEEVANLKGNFRWFGDNTFELKNLNLTLQQGQTLLIAGPNGSGKTSILYALLGELYSNSNSITTLNGSVSFAMQDPWIRQDTIKNNIIMDSDFDLQRFMRCLKDSQLFEDLSQMPAGFNTEIGEKGSSLSGGQKKRIHLCRALYQMKDIYILDNPSAALDHLTSMKLLESIAKIKSTKILTSNDLNLYNFVDSVIVLKDGQIVYQGTYQGALQHFPPQQHFEQDLDDIELEPQQQFANLSDQQLYDLFDKNINIQIQAEDRIYGTIEKSVFVQLVQLFGKLVFVIVAALSLLSMVLSILYQYQLSNITGISDNKDIDQTEKDKATAIYFWLYPITTIGVALCALFAGLILVSKGVEASIQLHERIINNLLRASVQYFYNLILSSRIKNRVTNDIYQFDMNSSQSIAQLISSIFNALSLFIACLALSSYKSYPAMIIFIYLEIHYTKKYLMMRLEVSRLQAISKSPLINSMTETASGIIQVKHCQDRQTQIAQFQKWLNEYQVTNINLTAIEGWYIQIGSLLMVFIYATLVTVNYFDESLSTQQATISVYLCVQFSEAFQTLLLNGQQFYQLNIYLERCLYLVNSVPREDQNQHEEYSNFQIDQPISFSRSASMITINSELQEMSPLTLQLENIDIKYRQDLDNVIKQVSFTLEKAQKLAIIGRTGSGKTSLMQCITRLISPSSGVIRAFGIDYNQQGINKIRQLFSVVSQDSFVFEGTLKENIDPNENFTDNQIRDLLAVYGLRNVSLFNDLQSKVSVNGENLSLGEKQLLQLVRTFLQDRRIVILDECTANLDAKYANLINASLELYMKNKSVIGITHKLEQLTMFDTVILLHRGKILAQGERRVVVQKYLKR